MLSSGWEITIFLLTLLIIQPPKCDGTPGKTKENKPVSFVAHKIGVADKDEDRYIQIENCADSGIGVFAVLDGHGGKASAEDAKEHLENSIAAYLKSNRVKGEKLNAEDMLKEVIGTAESELKRKFLLDQTRKHGTTCIIAIAEKEKLTVANVGDSRAVLCKMNNELKRLSTDHNIPNEKEIERIHGANDRLWFRPGHRARFAGLETTRTVGDFDRKEDHHALIADPEFEFIDFSKDEPKFMILASDGLWAVMENEEAVEFIKDRYKQPDHGANDLVEKAFQRTKDDITVIIVDFEKGHYEVSSAHTCPKSIE